MTKLDTAAAWHWASAAIAANREVLLALAGVFFLLPRLAVGLFGPDAHIQQGMGLAEAQAAMQAYYLQALPWLLPTTLLEAVGTLAMLTLMTDHRRPTVRDAIAAGFRAVAPYIAGELIFGVGLAFVGGLLISLAALAGGKPAAGAALIVVMVALVYGFIRLILLAPVVAVERVGNPLRALARAWALSRGQMLRLVGLFALLAVVALVILMASVGIAGSLAAIAFGPDGGQVAGVAIEAVLDAVFAVYFVGVLVAVHRQLAGPAVDAGGLFG